MQGGHKKVADICEKFQLTNTTFFFIEKEFPLSKTINGVAMVSVTLEKETYKQT